MNQNHILLGVAAIAGVMLLRKQQPTPKQTAIASGRQTYSTPTSVAAALGAFVAAYTTRATPTVRTDNVVGSNWKPWGDQATQAARDWTAANPALGVYTFGAGMPNVDEAWRPRVSFVDAPMADSSSIDSFPQGAVYSVGTDFVQNPFQLAAP